MQNLVFILLIGAMIATLAALAIGIFTFVKGGEFNRKHANFLMRLRIACQGLAVGLFILYIVLNIK